MSLLGFFDALLGVLGSLSPLKKTNCENFTIKTVMGVLLDGGLTGSLCHMESHIKT